MTLWSWYISNGVLVFLQPCCAPLKVCNGLQATPWTTVQPPTVAFPRKQYETKWRKWSSHAPYCSHLQINHVDLGDLQINELCSIYTGNHMELIQHLKGCWRVVMETIFKHWNLVCFQNTLENMPHPTFQLWSASAPADWRDWRAFWEWMWGDPIVLLTWLSKYLDWVFPRDPHSIRFVEAWPRWSLGGV